MIESLVHLSPAWPIIIAGLISALLPFHHARKGLALIAPFLAAALWANAPHSEWVGGIIEFGGFELVTFRFDGLSRIWGLIFIIATFINAIYSLHDRDRIQDASALIYSGAAIGVIFAGDLLTVFFFWELTALSSVFLIWASRNPGAYRAGLRYLAIHVLSGVLLLTGAILHANDVGSWAFDSSLSIDTLGGLLIFLGFGIKCAFPFLHNWLQDAYPKATVTGAVILSAFTTKMAVYALARGFAETEILIYIGMVMTAFPVFFAVIENDLRKVLSYSLNNQLGFMVVGVGVGTPLALDGAAAHAFVHIIYKALLFMSLGAVLYRTGTTKASELGGLFKSMPVTAVFTLIGAASISAFPLFSGFIAKSLTLAALAQEGYVVVWIVLIFASAGVLEHSGIKIPWFTFFAHDSGKRVKEAPANMLIAMGLAAFLCIYLGINYGQLYSLLPYWGQHYGYDPYTTGHIVSQMQLLMAAVFAFAFLLRMRWYPPEIKSVNLDTDWIYRRLATGIARWGYEMIDRLAAATSNALAALREKLGSKLFQAFSPAGALSRDIPSGVMAIWTSALLAVVLLIAYLAP